MKKSKFMKIYFIILFSLILLPDLYSLKPDTTYRVRPENYGLIFKEDIIETPDNYHLKTWFFPAQTVISLNEDSLLSYFDNPRKRKYELIDKLPKPTIIICNGDAANMAGLIIYVRGFLQYGYNIVTFDWRGFGESDYFPIKTELICHTEFLIDYETVVNTITQYEEVDENNIGVFGFSTGAYLSFAIAHTNEKIKCFAGRALMTSFEDFLPLLYEVQPEKKGIVKPPSDYPLELYPIQIAPNFRKPAFLIVGENDTRTPPIMSQEIYNKLKGEKSIWIVKDAEHGGTKAPEFIDFNSFLEKTISFYDQHLKKSHK